MELAKIIFEHISIQLQQDNKKVSKVSDTTKIAFEKY